MTLSKFLKKYVLILFITMFALLGSFFGNILINMIYGKEVFGVYSTMYNIIMLFSSFVAFGVGPFLLREVSINESLTNFLISKIKRFISTTYVLTLIGMLFFLYFVDYSLELKLLILICIPIIYLMGLINLYTNLLLGLKRVGLSTVINTTFPITIIIILIISIFLNLGFMNFILFLVLTSIFIIFIYFNKIGEIFSELKVNLTSNRYSLDESYFGIIKGVLPFGVMAIAYSIYYQSDILFISFYMDSKSVAEYNAAFSILAALLIFPRLLFQKLFAPYVYSKWNESLFFKSKKFYIYNFSLVIISLLLYIILFIFSDSIILLVFGNDYLHASTIIKIIGISFVIRFIYGFSGIILNLKENLNFKMTALIITAIINLSLNMILIPVYGIYGAAYSTVFCEVILCILMQYKYYKLIRGN